jgi:uncharacterized protein (DUF433 family)
MPPGCYAEWLTWLGAGQVAWYDKTSVGCFLGGVRVVSVVLDSMLVKTPGVCGGRIRIDGTRITVHRIATLYKQGQTAEDIAQTYPHLSLGQVYTALAYYHTNREEIEAELAALDAQYDELRGTNSTHEEAS